MFYTCLVFCIPEFLSLSAILSPSILSLLDTILHIAVIPLLFHLAEFLSFFPGANLLSLVNKLNMLVCRSSLYLSTIIFQISIVFFVIKSKWPKIFFVSVLSAIRLRSLSCWFQYFCTLNNIHHSTKVPMAWFVQRKNIPSNWAKPVHLYPLKAAVSADIVKFTLERNPRVKTASGKRLA